MPNIPRYEDQIIGRLIIHGSDPVGEVDREAMFDALDKLKPEMFASEFNSLLFSVICVLARKENRLPTLQEIDEAARRDPNLKRIGQIETRITELMTSGAETTVTFSVAVDHVVETTLQRDLSTAVEIAAGKLKDSDPKEAGNIIDDLQLKLDGIRDGGVAEYHGTPVGQIGFNLLEALELGECDQRISTGFPKIDRVLQGGFKRQTLNMIAARPSVGKSSMMVQMATAAAKQGNHVLIFSLEMSAQQIGEWMYRQAYGEKPSNLSIGKTTGKHTGDYSRQRAEEFSRLLGGLPITVYDQAADILRIESEMKRARRKGRTDIVFIDYAGIIDSTPEQRKGQRWEMIDENTRRLKALAKLLDIPVVLAAQVNRGGDKPGESPRLKDLKESGGLEQNADVVLLLWRPDDEDRTRAQIIVGKQRDGIAGESIDLNFDGPGVFFAEIGAESEAETIEEAGMNGYGLRSYGDSKF